MAPGWLSAANLAAATGYILQFAAPGNQADSGIMEEVYAELTAMGIPPHEQKGKKVCEVLARFLQAAIKAKDKNRKKRIETTEKAKECRNSRHLRGL